MRWRIPGCVALVALAACQQAQPPRPVPSVPANVLLITIDTLRADRLGRGFTPTLDALAARGLVFSQARTAAPLTFPAHATILSGLLPPRHGVRENGVSRFANHPTLATILRGRGFVTAAAVGAFVLARQFGLDAGFDAYDDAVARRPGESATLEAERPAGAVTRAAAARLAALPGGAPSPSSQRQPFFLWVHYYDPHAPYDPPAEFRARAGGDAYNGEIAYVDAEVRRLLFDELKLHVSPRGRDTLVVVAGDHGESLGEHGEATHGMSLYDGALRVPLIVARVGAPGPANTDATDVPGPGHVKARLAGPGTSTGRRDEPVSLADVAPTILAAVGVQPPAGLDGVDLLAGAVRDREIYAETLYPRVAGWTPLTALLADGWKLIAGARVRLFEIAADPGEQRNRADDQRQRAAGMEVRARALIAAAASSENVLTAETRERLRALGYVAAAPAPVAPSAPDPEDRLADWNAFESISGDLATPRRPAAMARLRQLAARNPGGKAFETTLARVLGEDGRRREALEAYRRAAARWPGDAVLMHDLAVAAREAGQPSEALRAEEAALAIAPADPAALNGLGLLHAEAGRLQDAVATFERAVKLQDDPSYWSNLGNARRAIADLAGARAAYERALALDASWPDAANGLAVLLVQAGQPLQAIPWLEKALARAPDFLEGRLNLGIACQEAGRLDCARASYARVLAAGRGHDQQKAAARQLLGAMTR